jgi:hypothetical protein
MMNLTPLENLPQAAVLTNLWNEDIPDSAAVPVSAGPFPNNTNVGGWV